LHLTVVDLDHARSRQILAAGLSCPIDDPAQAGLMKVYRKEPAGSVDAVASGVN
jgi:hypothetical protein